MIYILFFRTCSKCFNRYMVECELKSLILRIKKLSVLIDTWWNVNETTHNLQYLSKYVLIDTWWNVNVRDEIIFDLQNQVLIDTWWNVNKRVINGTFGELWVLIDTWWNVNLYCSLSTFE